MDECLPLGSMDAPKLRMLLEKERANQQGLEQEIAGLQEHNALLRQQVALLEAENTRLRGTPRLPKPLPGAWPSERTKTEREETPRKKRDDRHNRGRHRMAQVDERMTHAAVSY